MAVDPNLPPANYVPDFKVAGGYVPGQVESTGGGYVPGSDATATATAAKYADTTNIAPSFAGGYYGEQTESSGGGYDPNSYKPVEYNGAVAPNFNVSKSNAPSSMPPVTPAAKPIINGVADTRVRLKVPSSYLIGYAEGPSKSLVNAQGIIFPYTPTIGFEHKATYANVNAPHSNYTQYFYKFSNVSEIAISAKFTVQNEAEAANYLAVVHLLRALTKMRFGDDTNAGSPPPVCRLMAYGDFMLDNVPVAVTSFKVDLPDNVDYFNTGRTIQTYGTTSVPVLSTMQVTLIPIYSRSEMLKGTVDKWLSGDQRKEGYL